MPQKQNNRKVYPDANRQPRQDAKFRVEEAKERQAHSDSLTPQQKLERLDAKLGKNVGAQKQRLKLNALLEKQHKPQLETK